MAVKAVSTTDWRSSWAKRAQVAFIAGLGYPLINALGYTLRWRVEGAQHYDAVIPWRRVEMTYKDGCKIVLDGDNREKWKWLTTQVKAVFEAQNR